jgi:hypothetical protein
MRYVTFVFGTLLLHAGVSMAQNAPPTSIGLAEGNPSAVDCPAGQYLAGFNIWTAPQMSGLSPYCVAMQPDGRWQSQPQIHLESTLNEGLRDSVRIDMFCPRDHYAFGLAGLSQVYGIHGINQLTLYCHDVKTGASMGIATQTISGISNADWPAVQCGDTAVATGAFGRSRDGEIIQLGLTCNATQPAIAQARLQSATESTSTAARQPNRRGPGVITGERPYNAGISPSSPSPPSTLAAGSMNWSAMAHPNPNSGYQGTPGGYPPGNQSAYARNSSSVLAAAQSGATMTNGSAMTSGGAVANVSTMTKSSAMAGTSAVMPAHSNRSLPVPALTATPVPGAASALATSTASRTIDLNSAAVKSGIIIVSGKGATGIRNTGPNVPSPSVNLPTQSSLTQ